MTRGIKSSVFIFNEEQIKFMKPFIQEFESVVHQINPDFKPHCKALTDWKESTARTIMDDDLFEDLVTDDLPRSKWEEVIRRRFTNHFNNKMHRDKKNASSSSKVTTSSTERSLDDILHRALVVFTGDFPARDLFAYENDTALKAKISTLKQSYPTLSGGALRNKALGILWKDADHDVWESKIAEMAGDIHSNQSNFPALIERALQNLCQTGRLGSTIMTLTYAFRDKDDGITSGIISTGFDSLANSELNHEVPDCGDFLDKWEQHSDAILPRKPVVERVHQIPLNEDGLPVFPNIEIALASLKQLVNLFKSYLLVLWKHLSPNDEVIPWTDIVQNPDNYYDTSKFCLPVKLQDPDLYLSTPSSIFLLHGFFKDASTSAEPFQFRFRIDSPEEQQVQPIPALPSLLSPTPSSPLNPPRQVHSKIDSSEDQGVQPIPALPSPPSPAPSSPLSSVSESVYDGDQGSIVAGPAAGDAIPASPMAVKSTSVTGRKPQKKPVTPHSVTPDSTIPGKHLTAHTRKSTRKRKEPDTSTVDITEKVTEGVKRKKKPSYFYIDSDGNYLNADGVPVDKDGNHLVNDSGPMISA